MIKVKVRVSRGDREVIVPALVNSGYETDAPELLAPVKIAEDLGLWPETKEATMEYYKVAGGEEIRVVRLKKVAKVEILAEEHASQSVLCDLAVSEGEEELIIGDKLISKLGLVMIDAGEGIWCFKDEIGKKERKSYL
jgi:hypothetical protein